MTNEVPGLPRLRYPSGVTVPEALPQKLGPYRLHRRLGVGGMAETFVASREGATDLVCVKKVLPAFAQDRSFVEQFQREAVVAGQLRHANIVGLLDYGADAGELFMAMELVEGIDLAELLQAQPHRRLPEDVAALVVHDLALGLGHAHRAAIVHRDVTPSNVLLGRDGRVKLADFGVAKALTSTTVATATGFLKGKVPYMAPEYIQGQGVSPSIDLFSLGVVLYECLAGRRPFVGSNDVEVMMRLMTTRAARLAGVSEGLADLAAKMLDRDPSTRPETAEQVASLLTAHFDLFDARARLIERIGAVARTPALEQSWSKESLASASPAAASETPSTAVMNPLAVALPDRTAIDLRTPVAEVAQSDARVIAARAAQPSSPSDEDPFDLPTTFARPRLLVVLVGVLVGASAVGGWAWYSRGSRHVPAVSAAPTTRAVDLPSEPDDHLPEPTSPPALAPTPEAAAAHAPSLPVGVEPPEAPRREESTSEQVTRPEPSVSSSERRVRRRASERDAPARSPSPEPESMAPVQEPPSALEEGVVEVVVVPWGFVWIDGRRVGRSPVRTRVSAGTHTIRAGFEAPTSPAQRVEVPRGSTRRLELVIED